MGWRRVAVYLYISTRCQRHYLWDYLQHYLREMQFSGFVPQCTLAGGSCCASLPPLFVCLPHQVGWGGTTGVLLAVVVVEVVVVVVVGVEVVVDILVVCLTAIKCASVYHCTLLHHRNYLNKYFVLSLWTQVLLLLSDVCVISSLQGPSLRVHWSQVCKVQKSLNSPTDLVQKSNNITGIWDSYQSSNIYLALFCEDHNSSYMSWVSVSQFCVKSMLQTIQLLLHPLRPRGTTGSDGWRDVRGDGCWVFQKT